MAPCGGVCDESKKNPHSRSEQVPGGWTYVFTEACTRETSKLEETLMLLNIMSTLLDGHDAVFVDDRNLLSPRAICLAAHENSAAERLWSRDDPIWPVFPPCIWRRQNNPQKMSSSMPRWWRNEKSSSQTQWRSEAQASDRRPGAHRRGLFAKANALGH